MRPRTLFMLSGAGLLVLVMAVGAIAGPHACFDPKAEGAYDIDQSATVGASDLTIIFANGFVPPGPSTRACADCAVAVGINWCP
jgi:hypothetical protein